jgi:hypothetical protein
MLFTKPIREISYEDVVQFCEGGLHEGANLDYKADFPKDLEKTISALANTYGGAIIIGVEDDDGRPKPPFLGIDCQPGLEERVTSIAIDAIFPPIVPEVAVCKSTSGKAFIVIRVAESDQTPHAIAKNTKAYVRTGSISKSEESLSFAQIEWLSRRREKSEHLRLDLYGSAEDHFANIIKHEGFDFGKGEFTLSFAPMFPSKPIFALHGLPELVNRCSTKNINGWGFPEITESLEPIKDGYYSLFQNRETWFGEYLELNHFGLVFEKSTLCWSKKQDHEGDDRIRLVQILDTLDLAFETMAKLYKEVGYWGLIEVRCSLRKALNRKVAKLRFHDYEVAAEDSEIIADDQMEWQSVVSVTELVDPLCRRARLMSLFSEIAWALGSPTEPDAIETKLRERNRLNVEQNKAP